jgi:hypothetical protein
MDRVLRPCRGVHLGAHMRVAQRYPAWRLVSLDHQWQRFTAEVPQGERPVLARRHFDEWGVRFTSLRASTLGSRTSC